MSKLLSIVGIYFAHILIKIFKFCKEDLERIFNELDS